MDSEDHRKNSPSGHESHGVHVCHKCGWPFPNPHPSAKHRRAHKRICGTIEGYKLIDSEEYTHLTLSDDEQLSDEDKRTPSPKIENRSIKEISSGGFGERSNRSEYEVFSDAVAEFSDSGFNPGFEEHLEGGRELDKNMDKFVEGTQSQLLKVDATADTMHPPDNPANTSQLLPEVLERATNQLGSTTPVQDIVSSYTTDSMVSSALDTRTEDLAVGLSSINGSACDFPSINSKTLTDAPEEYINANVGDDGMQCLMTCHGQETDVKGNEENNIDKTLSDDVAVPARITANKESEESKLPEMDRKTSDPVRADGIKSKEEQNEGLGPKMSKHDISPEVESAEHMEAFVNSVHVKADSAQDIDVGSHGGLVQVCKTKGEGNEDIDVLSVANDLPVVDHPEIMIKDFKDHRAVKSNLPLSLGPGEVIRPVEDDTKDTVYEERHSNSYSSKPGESINISSAYSNSLEEGGGNKHIVEEVPVEREADTSEFKVLSGEDLGSSSVDAPLGTIKTESEEVQTNHCFEGLQPHDFDNDLSQNISSEYNTRDLSYVIPTVTSVVDKVNHITDLSGGDNADDHELDKIGKFDKAKNDSREGALEEKLSANRETPPESADNICVPEVDEITNLLGPGDTSDREMAGIEFSDIAGNESTEAVGEEKCAMNTKTTLESACHLSKSQVVANDGMDKVVRNLQESESTYLDRVSDSSKVGIGMSDLGNITQTRSNSQNCQDEDNSEVLAEYVVAVAVSMGAASNHDGDVEVVQKSSENFNLKEPEPLPVDSEFTIKNSANVEDSHSRDGDRGVSGVISSEPLQEEGDENLTKRVGVSAVDISVDSSSQTESLEGNWGSVSVLSNQSDAPVAVDAGALPSTHSQAAEQSEKANSKTASEQHHSDKSDVFDPPSFMTLVESGGGVDQKAAASEIQTVESTQQPKSEDLKAGWFPSLTNVINESQGRKKNEEIIAKVTNWSTGKQHSPLKSLLGEANPETKPKSPSPKQTPTVIQKDETAANNNGASATTVYSILGPEDEAANRDAGKEWNSPARYPTDNKKDKRKVKGKPYWVPFVCCSSVN
uniref:C2H2-type domain-containing protein n=1 Tax=Davidia involucrata TaxID=16924 RepID=A0A5B7A6Z5_DAVIN